LPQVSKKAAPLRGAEAPGDLSTFTPYPVLTVVNFGKIIPEKPANRERRGSAGRRSRANLYFAAILEIDRWGEDYPVSLLDAVADLDLCPEVADFGDLAAVRDTGLDDRYVEAVAVENDRPRRHDQGRRPVRDLELDRAVD
jgi:hypothetical protein